jgi:hypothetical protein
MIRMSKLRTVALILALTSSLGLGCSHSSKRGGSNASSSKSDSKGEEAAAKAVELTEVDERYARAIQKEVNAIFFGEKKENPGGLHAFSPDRIQDLEVAILESTSPVLKYYRENREYFDRVEDAGGGFRVAANARRLIPHRWTEAGRHKLFRMDMARVKEMIANPCFSEIEDCGEYSSDGEENTTLLGEWKKKYAEKEYRSDREKVLRSYVASLKKYRKRVARGVPKKMKPPQSKESKRITRAREAALLVGTHIRAIESLLKD